MIAVEREDGSSNKRFEVAHGKAHGAVSLGMGSRSLMERAEQQPYFVAAVTHSVGALVPVPGGVLVRPPTAPCSARSASPATPPTTTRRPPWPASSRPGWWVRRTDVPIVDVELVGETLVTATPRSAWPTPSARHCVASRRDLGAGPAARSAARYAENGGCPEGVQPVFVTVLERHPSDGDGPGREGPTGDRRCRRGRRAGPGERARPLRGDACGRLASAVSWSSEWARPAQAAAVSTGRPAYWARPSAIVRRTDPAGSSRPGAGRRSRSPPSGRTSWSARRRRSRAS